MLKTVFVVAKGEFKSLLKNWITIISIIVFIGTPIFIYSPIESGYMWKVQVASYQCNSNLVNLAMLIIPFIVINIYYKDEVTEMPVLIFSQPVTKKAYAAGKFLGGYLYCLFFAVIENIIWILIPVYFKRMIYSPILFLKYFTFYCAISFLGVFTLAYFLEVIFKLKPLTIFLPIFLSMGLAGEKSSKFGVILFQNYTSNLYSGRPLSKEVINYIMFNRIFILTLSMLLIIISILKFSPKKLMDRR